MADHHHQLSLVRANKSRGGGHWSDDDYDVRQGSGRGPVIGRIDKCAIGWAAKSVVAPIAYKMVRRGERSEVPIAANAPQQTASLFDHIICETRRKKTASRRSLRNLIWSF